MHVKHFAVSINSGTYIYIYSTQTLDGLTCFPKLQVRPHYI